MNGIEKITARLAAEAQEEIDIIDAGAKQKCGEIKAEYEKKAKAEYDRRIAAGKKAVEDRKQRLGSAAEMEAKKSTLAFKQEMVSKAFDRAVEMIGKMPRKDYVAFLAAQAAKAAGEAGGVLVFNARDRERLSADVLKSAEALLKKAGSPANLSVAEDTRDIPGGLIIRQGDIEFNCAIDTLVQLYRSELSPQVAEILFA